MRNELRKLLQCPLDWVVITNQPSKRSILEADWHYAVEAMAVDPDDIPFDEDWIDVDRESLVIVAGSLLLGLLFSFVSFRHRSAVSTAQACLR
jgi:hypothetical protein